MRVGDGVIGVAVIAMSAVAVGFSVGVRTGVVVPGDRESICRAFIGAGDGVTDGTGVRTAVTDTADATAAGGVPAAGDPDGAGFVTETAVIVTEAVAVDTPTRVGACIGVAVAGSKVEADGTVAFGATVLPRGGAITTWVDPTAVRTDPKASAPAPVASATMVSVALRTASFGTSKIVQLWPLPAGTEQLP